MARLVMKFGGTSVGDFDRMTALAARVKRSLDDGHEVAVVVSAMAGKTNDLIDMTRKVANGPTETQSGRQEYDAIVSAGEQMSAGLMALAMQEEGIDARSWLGWQLPIRTSSAASGGRIQAIETSGIEAQMAEGGVPVIAGFQGLSDQGRITTLGRGASDITAVALAVALKADRCDIYTDVEGVYTADPRIVPKARKLAQITYEEMLEMASQGARVLQTRSVELAMKHSVNLVVLSSTADVPGTEVTTEDKILEQELVSGIAYSNDEAKITLTRVEDQPGVAAAVFGRLADAEINVDMIVQNVSEDGKTTDLTFTVPSNDLDRSLEVLENAKDEINYGSLSPDTNVVKVSVIGVGMRSHAGVAQKMFATLAEKGINIKVISTSEIKVSVLIASEYAELAVRALHTAYGLDAE